MGGDSLACRGARHDGWGERRRLDSPVKPWNDIVVEIAALVGVARYDGWGEKKKSGLAGQAVE